MPTGMSINIGIEDVSPRLRFDGLLGCEKDARDMHDLAHAVNFVGDAPILGARATLGVVKIAIEAAAAALIDGDILLLTYSGHGSQVLDHSGDEDDDHDETWVLYDDQLIDDELYALLARFEPGVRILVLSDSCKSGTVIQRLASTNGPRVGNGGFLGKLFARFGRPPQPPAEWHASEGRSGVDLPRAKTPSYQAMLAEYFRNRAYYDDRILKHRASPRPQLRASVILISACQEEEYAFSAASATGNSVFTKALLQVWAGGAFSGGYSDFRGAIAKVTPGQTPVLLPLGPADPTFLNQKPFTI